MKKISIFLLIFVLAVTSCSKNDLTDDPEPTPVPFDAKQVFGLSTLNLIALSSQATKLEISDSRATQSSFTITTDADWLKFSSIENDANPTTSLKVEPLTKTTVNVAKKVYVYAGFNTTTKVRTAKIKLDCAGYPTVELEVIQAAADARNCFGDVTSLPLTQVANKEKFTTLYVPTGDQGVTYTLVSNADWLNLSVDGQGEGAKSIEVAPGVTSFYVHTTEIMTLVERSSSIYLNVKGGSNTFKIGELTVAQNGPTFPTITAANSGIISYNAATGRLDFINNTAIGNMLYFKYGSVVGLSTVNDWSAAEVKFNPSAVTITNDWASVPYTTAKDITQTYQTPENVSAGKGDPCRLIGLSIMQIKAGLVDNKKFRLPTAVENEAFATNRSDWKDSPNIGRYFGPEATASGTGGFFLPAGGYRNEYTGAISDQDGIGRYWSGIHNSSNDTDALNLTFGSYFVRPSQMIFCPSGFLVRCVAQ